MATQPGEYLRTKVMTASPEELQLMLYDGAIRYASQAREQLAGGNLEQAYHLLLRAQRIVLEMTAGLRHEVNPELCGRLAGLYNFIHRKLVEANMTRQTEAIDDALQILTYERDTWNILIDKIKAESADQADPGPDEAILQAQPASPSKPASKGQIPYAAPPTGQSINVRG